MSNVPRTDDVFQQDKRVEKRVSDLELWRRTNAGSVGPPGPAGPSGLAWQGGWAAGTPYAINDAVTYLGSSYRRLAAGTTATTPDADSANWAVIASKGTPGADGAVGATGAVGPTGAAGAVGPAGPAGPVGATGGNATVPMDPWHLVGTAGEPAFAAGVSNKGGGEAPVAFRKDPLGRVQVRGVANVPSAASSPLFTLPPADCPAVGFARTFGDDWNTNNPCHIAVGTNGIVTKVTAGVTVIDLSPLVFDTDSVTQMPTGPQGPAGAPGATGGGAFVGQIVSSGLPTVPSTYQACDGTALAVGVHPTLRAALVAASNPWGVTGSNPKVPNLGGVFLLGKDGTHALGTTGGEATHLLTTAEMPSHAHGAVTQSGSTPDHTHVLSAGTVYLDVGGGAGFIASGGPRWAFAQGGNTGASDRSLAHTHPITAEGGGGAHNNMPPYAAVNYMIYSGD